MIEILRQRDLAVSHGKNLHCGSLCHKNDEALQPLGVSSELQMPGRRHGNLQPLQGPATDHLFPQSMVANWWFLIDILSQPTAIRDPCLQVLNWMMLRRWRMTWQKSLWVSTCQGTLGFAIEMTTTNVCVCVIGAMCFLYVGGTATFSQS